MQQGVQTDATCNIQQCWELLVNNVASVCTQPKELVICNNRKTIIFPWEPEKTNVIFHKKCENSEKILKISCVRFHFVKFDIYFLEGSHQKFSLVLLQITNYIYSPWKMWKNAICLKLFMVKGLCPLKIKITQFPDGFHLNILL